MIERLQPGDKSIPSGGWNEMADAADVVNRGKLLHETAAGSSGATTILVKNLTGQHLGRFSVVGLDGFVVDPASNRAGWKNGATLKGVTPVIQTHHNRFAILQTALRANATGPALIEGVTPARVTFNTDHDEEWAAPVDGATGRLIAGAGNARIIDRTGGSGEQWAYVRLAAAGAPRWFPVQNKTSLETIPPYGLVQLTSLTTCIKCQLGRPTAPRAVTWPLAIADQAWGLASFDWPLWVNCVATATTGFHFGPNYNVGVYELYPIAATGPGANTEGGYLSLASSRPNPAGSASPHRVLATWGREYLVPEWIRFTLDDPLTSSDDFVMGTVVDCWGGSPDITGQTVELANAEDEATGNYIFSGPAGRTGIAARDWPRSMDYTLTHPVVGWRIVWVKC